jgi:hypothetical protein
VEYFGEGPMARGDLTMVRVQIIRSWTGLLVVIFGDAAVASAAIWGIVKAGSTENAQLVSILTSAFTAIVAMTTAYFGIRAASNTAQSAVEAKEPAQNDERRATT